MPRPSLELVPDDAGRETVRGLWQRLREAGLPSQLDHSGASNEAHLTVVESETLDPDTAEVGALGGLLPVTVAVPGLVVLGGPRSVAVALLVVPPPELAAAVDAVRPPDARPWVPHVTLGRRLERTAAGEAVAALDDLPERLVLTELRHWQPADRTLTILASARS